MRCARRLRDENNGRVFVAKWCHGDIICARRPVTFDMGSFLLSNWPLETRNSKFKLQNTNMRSPFAGSTTSASSAALSSLVLNWSFWAWNRREIKALKAIWGELGCMMKFWMKTLSAIMVDTICTPTVEGKEKNQISKYLEAMKSRSLLSRRNFLLSFDSRIICLRLRRQPLSCLHHFSSSLLAQSHPSSPILNDRTDKRIHLSDFIYWK